ncbi:MAG: tyrosine-type recombinase/integrase [Terriglobales bacterium]
MLITSANRYISLRQTLGFKLRELSLNLNAFARFAAERGETHIRIATAVAWATEGSSPHARYVRLRDVARFARFLHAEDPAHEVPMNPFHAPVRRRLPYIYTPKEILQLIEASGRLRQTYPLRRQVYGTLLGLIAATGLRISEALNLRLQDVLPDGVLQICRTKFDKGRMIPLHPTAEKALGGYLEQRRQMAVEDDHVFLSAGNRRISCRTADYTFRRVVRLAGIALNRKRPPRIHDLRHAFATRALERCAMRYGAVGRHFVALATYMGHSDIADTYWYLEATPELMTGIAAAAGTLVAMEGTK